jgi:hypothetical protein
MQMHCTTTVQWMGDVHLSLYIISHVTYYGVTCTDLDASTSLRTPPYESSTSVIASTLRADLTISIMKLLYFS